MNHTSTKSPIAAATVEMISERLAKLSMPKRLPDEKPNTVVSTLWDRGAIVIRSRSKRNQTGEILTR